MTNASPSSPPAVQRQIVLPLRKAVEIAYKNIRMRLSRSLLVTSGIVLALAFLMAILANGAMVDGMRAWMAGFKDSPRFAELAAHRQQIEKQAAPLYETLRMATVNPPPLAADQTAIEPKEVFGADLVELPREIGALPGPADALTAALSAKPALIDTMKQWIEKQRQLKSTIKEQNGAEELRAMMAANGVPTSPQEVAADRTTTRWLLGLALLVAFVGILNAMLMSVTERFREIGTMKCLGALDSFIVKLFLIESLFQGIIGTILGIAVGLGLSFIGMSITYGGFAWKNVTWGPIFAGVGVCFLVGVALTVAGAVYPAWQAARMQPIEAMRVET